MKKMGLFYRKISRLPILFFILVAFSLINPGRTMAFSLFNQGQAPVDAILAFAPAVPPPLNRKATTVKVEMETKEFIGTLTDGTEYRFWSFNGTVPGPMVRIKVGDTVEFTLKNNKESQSTHSIDIHAVNGPGGGKPVTEVSPGNKKTFTWKSLAPGLYVYHCASAHIPTHIANGMYGMLLVEPKKGLKKVDREYYVMQSEFYTEKVHGAKGLQEFSAKKALQEHADYVVFNGSVGAVTGKGALTAKVGETVRIFIGNAGPNLISSFHIIGEIFDRVWHEGSTSNPATNVQTTLIPVAGAAIVEFKVDNPGTYVLVDHSIFRAIDKGAVGLLNVTGKENPEIFSPMP
jgi:nitrite reductase (NO-forming)